MAARATLAMLCVAAVAALFSEDQMTPYAAVPRGTAVIDGVLGAEWAGATEFPLCQLVGGLRVPWQQLPTARITWSETALHVAVEVPLGAGGPVAKAQARDAAVWEDDAAEIFLQPPGASDYLQFIANAAGCVYDGRVRDGSWNGDWLAAAVVSGERATIEFAIPWDVLGVVPRAGVRLRANFAADCKSLGGLVLSWANVGGMSLHAPVRFGEIVLSDRSAGTRILSLGSPMVRRLRVVAEPTGAPYVVTAEVRREGQLLGGPWSHSVSCKAGATLQESWEEAGPAEVLVAAHGSDGEALQRLAFSVDARPDLELDTLGLLDVGKLRLRARLNIAGVEEACIAWKLARSREERVFEAPSRKGEATVDVPLAELGQYQWQVEARAYDASGTLLAEAQAEWQTPWWYGSQAGMSDANWVPEPFTPVQVEGKKIRVWGREMDFSRGPLPVQIRSRGRPLLAAPISFVAETEAGPVAWRVENTRVKAVARGLAEVSGDLVGGGLRAEIRERVEFDGLIWMRVNLVPRGRVVMRKLHLEVPMRRACAELMTYQPFASGMQWQGGFYELNYRAVPDGPWQSVFRQYVWIGDDERGLEWLCGYPVNWRPKDNPKAVEILPGGPRTLFRARVMDEPTIVEAPLEYEFLLQASPVRPRPPNWRRIRYRHAAWYGMESTPSGTAATVSYDAQGNIALDRGTVQLWVVPNFDSEGPSPLNRALFVLDFPTEDTAMHLYWNLDDRGPRAVMMQGGQYTLIMGSHVESRPGQLIQFAMTWGDAVRIYADGKLVCERPFSGSVQAAIEEGRIILGGAIPGFAVHAMKISDTDLPAEALTAPLHPDKHTLLLDVFDRIETRGARRVTVAEFAKGDATGTVTGPAELATEAGQAVLRLYRPSTVLDHFAYNKCDFLAYHEHWTAYQSAPYTTYPDKLRSLADACRQRGIGLLLYHGALLADISPEYKLFGEGWLAKGPPGQPVLPFYAREPKQLDYPVCHNSRSWRDYICANMERTLAEYGIAGVYSDGLLYVGQCHNTLHGCPESGQSVHWHGMEAGRELAKRVYKIVRSRGPNTYIVMHTELALLPIFSFVDATLDGERFNTIPRSMGFSMPLDSFRAGFMGRPFGPTANFLVYGSRERVWTDEEGLSFTLIHDTLQSWSAEWEDRIQDAFDEFGVDDAQWIPYWRSGSVVQVHPEGVKASLYVKKGQGVLLALGNVTPQKVEVEVTLDLAKLGLDGRKLTAWDHLYRRKVQLDGATLRLKMRGDAAALVHVCIEVDQDLLCQLRADFDELFQASWHRFHLVIG